MASLTVADQVRQHLKSQEPLTPTSTRAIHDTLVAENGQPLYHTLREAVQKVSLGSKTSERRNTQTFFAVYLTLAELENVDRQGSLILTLPGVHRDFVRFMATRHIESVKERFAAVYGAETVSYWLSSTQLYSGALIKASQKKAVVNRDGGRCRVCSYVESAFKRRGVAVPANLSWLFAPPEKPRICHIISRRALFWFELERVRFSYNLDIFSKEGVVMLRDALANNPMHSDPAYMVFLCRRHDNLLQRALKESG